MRKIRREDWQAAAFIAAMGALAFWFGLLAWWEARALDEPSGEVGLKAAMAVAIGGMTVTSLWNLITQRDSPDQDYPALSEPPIRGWGVAYLMLATAVVAFGGAAALYITRLTTLFGALVMGVVGVLLLVCAGKSTPAPGRPDRDGS